MMKRKLLFLFCFFFITTASAWGGEPLQQISGTVHQIIHILSNEDLKAPEAQEERRRRLREAIFQRFDFAKMSIGAIGRRWRLFDKEQKKRFIKLFTQLLEKTYLSKLETYRGEKIRFIRDKEWSKGLARVYSILESRGDKYRFSYDMIKRPSGWKVYDVTIVGVRLTANYRRQFEERLRRISVDKLLMEIETKLSKS